MTDPKPQIQSIWMSHAECAPNECAEVTIDRHHFINPAACANLMRLANTMIQQWAKEQMAGNRIGTFKIDTRIEYTNGEIIETTFMMEPDKDQYSPNLGQWLWRSYGSVAGIYKPAYNTLESWKEWRNAYCDEVDESEMRHWLSIYNFDYEPTAVDLAHTHNFGEP